MRHLGMILRGCAILAAALFATSAHAVTKTASWTWPVMRTDGSALALAQIQGATIYDTSVPVPGAPGTVVPCTIATPFTAMGSCSVSVTTGHSFVMTVTTTDTPAETSAVSNSVTVPFAAPVAVTNFAIQ